MRSVGCEERNSIAQGYHGRQRAKEGCKSLIGTGHTGDLDGRSIENVCVASTVTTGFLMAGRSSSVNGHGAKSKRVNGKTTGRTGTVRRSQRICQSVRGAQAPGLCDLLAIDARKNGGGRLLPGGIPAVFPAAVYVSRRIRIVDMAVPTGRQRRFNALAPQTRARGVAREQQRLGGVRKDTVAQRVSSR